MILTKVHAMESKGSKIPIKHHLRTSNQKASKDEKVQPVESQNSDIEFNFSNMSYESMRLLVERKDRDLIELREFANLERESLRSALDEQQRISNLNLNNKIGINQTQNQGQSESILADCDKVCI